MFTDIEGSTRLLTRFATATPRCSPSISACFARRSTNTTVARSTPRATPSSSLSHGQATRLPPRSPRNERLPRRPGPRASTCACAWACTPARRRSRMDDYVGLDVHRAARICSAGHGGQVLISSSTRELVADELAPDVALRDLGQHRLKDLGRPDTSSRWSPGTCRATSRRWARCRPAPEATGCRRRRTGPLAVTTTSRDRRPPVRRRRPAAHADRPWRGRQDALGAGGRARGQGGLRRWRALCLARRLAAAGGCPGGDRSGAGDHPALGRVCRPGGRALSLRQAAAAGGRQLRARARRPRRSSSSC